MGFGTAVQDTLSVASRLPFERGFEAFFYEAFAQLFYGACGDFHGFGDFSVGPALVGWRVVGEFAARRRRWYRLRRTANSKLTAVLCRQTVSFRGRVFSFMHNVFKELYLFFGECDKIDFFHGRSPIATVKN